MVTLYKRKKIYHSGVHGIMLNPTPLGAGLRRLVGQKWMNGLNYVKFNF